MTVQVHPTYNYHILDEDLQTLLIHTLHNGTGIMVAVYRLEYTSDGLDQVKYISIINFLTLMQYIVLYDLRNIVDKSLGIYNISIG